MKNVLIGGLIVALAATVLWIGLSKKDSMDKAVISQTPVESSLPLEKKMSPTDAPEETPMTTLSGSIKGKLCYPSQFLPAGAIEAKNISSKEVFTKEYVGSQKGGGSTYTFDLPTGTYVLRYKAGDLYGYHTKTCPTGLETSCAASNARVNIEVQVLPGKEVQNVDLCDFYYDQKAPPAF